ncbi:MULTISPECIES: phosphoribosyltransferase [Corynebacterium]|uniref:phosphoribosyltransferase n=1 Tax=Corynebacterium TaxID=1716 RepID=UPI000668C6CE|nr:MULTISPECIES: phosphoribosyltransferase [Corynebacterium]OFK68287.1 phosphoribosyltransferase [Corynebacterium sp. HMSC074A09]OFN36690.1 phosphoribosyltransferase [Corynebacterium sp. HMSC072A04]OFN74155.1 phosphoribosyltransferase [Corynebacterium sp. HMSC070E08]OFO23571.1 phosphoribosyltransferase [Corynebacterium sp. HMSC056F09]OFO94471.1 phosphoribosyltransferase [Corynebacterium sp. HMSC034H07]
MSTPEWWNPERENLTWEVFGEASRSLSQEIVDSGWFPDLIVGVARGGLIPAGAIGYAIGVKEMGAINVEFYTDIGETLPEPILLNPQLDTDSLKGKKVLVVDDVADSGKTLDLVVNLLEQTASEVKSAVIYTKPTTIFEPDFSWKKTDQWINFAWSVLPVITRDGSFKDGH